MHQVLVPSDHWEISYLLARYGNIIDERQLSRTREVLTDDVHYDVSDFGYGVLHGVEAVVAAWASTDAHPIAHHVTNVEVTQDPDGTVRAISKIVGPGHRGRVGTATYYDVLTKTADGWRIAERVVRLRRPDNIPAIT